jgi:hypothetical protein
MWSRGDIVVVRYGRENRDGPRFTGGLPLYVLDDSDERVVGYLAEGTETAAPALADGRGLRDVPLAERWAHARVSVPRAWQRSDLVMIFPKGRRYSLWVFHERGVHVGWYVNLEAAHVFGESTISTSDGVLDIWVPADSREPVWKDEDEFAMAIEVGRLTAVEAAALRAEGERVIAERPWPTGWESWKPPADWQRPHLPEDWNSRD